MNLVIDIGNTKSKLAIFTGGEVINYKITDNPLSESTINGFINNNPINGSIISSVIKNNHETSQAFLKLPGCVLLNHNVPLPIFNKYKTPHSLGNDRIACAVGINQHFKNQNALSVDIGTCIKYDFVNDKNEYLGGAISPGLNMRFKSLHTFTDKLPLVNSINISGFIGNTTETSIISGVMNGITNEINGVISEYSADFKDLKVIITGGDHNLFVNALKNVNFADPYLLLKGLNVILEYNTQNS